MGREIYGYSDLESLKKSILSIQYTLAQIQSGGGAIGNNFRVVFAKVTEVVSDNEVKAIEEVWDSSIPGMTAPEGTPITFDSDADQGESYNEPNLQTINPLSVGDIVEVIVYQDKSNTTKSLVRPGAGGTPSIWITTSNTGLSFPDGARYDFPGGTGKALTVDDTFLIATPWNTTVAAPDNYFGYFNKVGDNWYQPIQQFYVKPNESYPSGAGAGIDDFDCYIDRSDSSLFLGNEASFPAGRKCILDDFDNVNATTNSRNYFNGKVFPARYDTATNIIYLEHPQF